MGLVAEKIEFSTVGSQTLGTLEKKIKILFLRIFFADVYILFVSRNVPLIH